MNSNNMLLDSSAFLSGQAPMASTNSLVDPESSMALGQEAGLIGALEENGFDFYIDFKEL